MTGAKTQQAWNAFWVAGSQSASGCLPNAKSFTGPAQAVWREAARPLPKRARVLDLATGDGIVLRTIRSGRSDLRLVGIDSASALPSAPKDVELRAGIRMERLPYGEDRFHLVTSQFGFEYGDTNQVAREIKRVLRSGSGFMLIAHHTAGPIVSHSLERRAALKWAVWESGLLAKARAIVTARRLTHISTPPLLLGMVQQAQAKFPHQSVATEFVMAVLQTLEWGVRSSANEQSQTLADLEQLAAGEFARIDALAAAAVSKEGAMEMIGRLSETGLVCEPLSELHEDVSGRVFAWRLAGRRE